MASSLSQNRQGKWKLAIKHSKAGVTIPAKFTYNGIPVAFSMTSTKKEIDTGWRTELGTSIDFLNEVTREYTPVTKDGIRYIVHKPENMSIIPYPTGDDSGDTPYLTTELHPSTVESGGGQVSLIISSNVSWEISDDAGYLSYSKTQGSNTDTVTIGVPAYTNTGTDRTIVITVIGSNGSTDQQMITQKKAYDDGGGDDPGPGPDDPGTDADYTLSITTGGYRSSGSYCPGLRGLFADSKLTSEEREDIKIDPTSWVVTKRRFNQSSSAVTVVVSNSVNDSDRDGCEFWICSERYDGVVEIHNGNGRLNIHGYGFKNNIVNDGYSLLYINISATTMGGKHVSTQISLKGKEYSFIDDGQSEPSVCPQTGGVLEYTFWYDNIDESTFGYTDLSAGISDITLISSGIPYSNPAAGTSYYQGKLAVTLTANQASSSEGYEGSRYKYFTITGMSTLDTTEEHSCRCMVVQEPYSYASFPYSNTSEYDTYDPNTSSGLLIIPLSGLNINNFTYRFCDHLSTKTRPIYIDDDATIETVVKEDNTTYNNEITFSEAIPISLEYGSVIINGKQINGYYLTIENQAWRIYDTHGGKLIELTFYDNAGNSWKDGLCIEKSWREDGSVSYITYRGYSHGWY